MTHQHRTVQFVSIWFLGLLATGCATDKPDTSRRELREAMWEVLQEAGVEKLDNGCYVWPPSDLHPEGWYECPEVQFPDEGDGEQAQP